MTNTNDLPDGYKRLKKYPGMIVSFEEPFPEPTLPGWGDLPTDLIQAMEEAHGNAAYAYGDEGNGYNPHLMLAYFLGSDEFKAWLAAQKEKP